MSCDLVTPYVTWCDRVSHAINRKESKRKRIIILLVKGAVDDIERGMG